MSDKRMLIEYLMRDGRNPYGSRGGYVVNRRPRRGRRGDRNDRGDYYDDGRYGDERYYSDYQESPYAYDSRDSERSRQYDRNYGSDRMRRYDDYDSHYGFEYNNMENMRLSYEEIEDWCRELENVDGSKGKHFHKEQIVPIAQQLGIRFDKEFNEEEFCMTVNMLYSDYCNVLGNDIGIYVKLAKAFLEDKDAAVKGGMKLALYYKCIVE